MNCRVCGLPECDCLIVPDEGLHLMVPPWESVLLVVDPAITVGEIRSFMAGRRECVVGLRASVPPVRVVVHLDAASALRRAAQDSSGDWHAALPPPPLAGGRKGPLRGFVADRGVVEVGDGGPYDVISHNWPRPVDPKPCHAGVLGIRWALDEAMLPQVESALDIARISADPVWVDYLCIDQDDEADKDALVARMGHVYSGASRGYVDCTHVPGVTTIDPLHVQELIAGPGSQADSDRRDALRTIVEAPWFSRCWTFQEALITPRLTFYDPSRRTTTGTFDDLRARCLEEFRHLHSSRGHDVAKREGWFGKAVSMLSYTEMIDSQVRWNLGRILRARGRRYSTLDCDQLNSLVGILDVGCGYAEIPTAQTLDVHSFRALVEACGNHGDTSWIAGEDTILDDSALSWAPSSVYAQFTTQSEADSVGWVRMTDDGPELRFHRSYPVSDTIAVTGDATATLSRLVGDGVGGDWLAEYCGVAFGRVMDDPLPVDPSTVRAVFGGPARSIDGVERELRSLLPPGAEWRADELRNYLTGLAGRFNSWIVCRTPARRIAFLATLVAGAEPTEVLAGTPAPSEYRSTHRYIPLMAVDGAPVARRLGWVWPCVHATLDASEAEPDPVSRIIRR